MTWSDIREWEDGDLVEASDGDWRRDERVWTLDRAGMSTYYEDHVIDDWIADGDATVLVYRGERTYDGRDAEVTP